MKPEAQRAPWYERALFKLRELLRKIFPKLRISRRDIETLLREAAYKLRRGQGRQGKTGEGEGTRFAVEKKPASVKEFLEMPGHTRPPRLNLTKQTPTAELFRVFKEHILDADITTPEGYRLVANEGHFYSFCCGKKDGVSKGFIARAKDAQEALRMVKESSISSSEMSGFEIDRLRNIKTYVDVMTDPDFSFREGDKITYGKKYDDIEDANGYTSVVLNLKGNELRPVHSGIERLTKDRLEGQNIKWYVKRTTGDPSEIPGSPTGETSEEQSGGYPNIPPSGEKSSGEIRKSVEAGHRIYSLELDEIRKPSEVTGGEPGRTPRPSDGPQSASPTDAAKQQPTTESYNKLLQKIEKARDWLKKSGEKSSGADEGFRYALSADDRDIVQMLRAKVGREDFDDAEVLEYLHDNGVECTPEQAVKYARRAMVENRAAAQHAAMLKKLDWVYENVPLYKYAVDFGNGRDFTIKPSAPYIGIEYSGSFIAPNIVKYSHKRQRREFRSDREYNRYLARREAALKNASGTDSDALAKYIVEQQGGGDWKAIENEIIEFYKNLKKPELYGRYYVHEVLTEEEIRKSGGPLPCAPEMQTRGGSPSDLYRNILRNVLNVKRKAAFDFARVGIMSTTASTFVRFLLRGK